MKKFRNVMILCALLLAAGCTSEEPDAITGDVAKPAWADPTSYDMTASMTAIMDINLSYSFPAQVANLKTPLTKDEDLLAAFDGETCLGVAKLVDGLFFLYITAPVSGEESESAPITLKYYSKDLSNIFVGTEKITFRNDTQLGSIAEPYTPKFVVEKK